jgi:hypothetical protein
VRRVLIAASVTMTISLIPIGARFVQVEKNHPAAMFNDNKRPPASAPKAYTPKRATPHLAHQRRKQRPPIVLGALDQAGVGRYCLAEIGPLTTAALENGAWVCKPLLGTPTRVNPTAACRQIFDDTKAEARPAGAGSWRCVKEAA